MTKSETTFSNLMEYFDISVEKIPEGDVKSPDFKLFIEGQYQYWEIKELKENPEELQVINDINNDSNDIFTVNSKRVERIISDAAKQFKDYGVTNFPCVVALMDNRDFAVKDFLLPNWIRSSMLGNAEIFLKNGVSKELHRRPGLFTNRKKYISAVVLFNTRNTNIWCFHNPNTENSIIESSLTSIFVRQEVAVQKENGLCWETI